MPRISRSDVLRLFGRTRRHLLTYLCRPLVGCAFNGPSPQHKIAKWGMVAPPIDQRGDRRAGWITVFMPRSIAHFSRDWAATTRPFHLHRSLMAGGRIWMDNPCALAQQYWRYGKAQHWRMMHWIRPKPRQMAAAHLAAHGCCWYLALAPLW